MDSKQILNRFIIVLIVGLKTLNYSVKKNNQISKIKIKKNSNKIKQKNKIKINKNCNNNNNNNKTQKKRIIKRILMKKKMN